MCARRVELRVGIKPRCVYALKDITSEATVFQHTHTKTNHLSLKMNPYIILSTLLALTSASTISTIFHFPNGTWLENIATTHNSSLLVSLFGISELRLVHPSTRTSNATSSLVANFPNANAVLGITALTSTNDVFAVAVGSTTPPNNPVPGSFSIWKVDIGCETGVEVSKIADLPEVYMVNGIAMVNHELLFLADSSSGNIVALNLSIGTYKVALTGPNLAANNSAALPFGVNGIRFHSPYLYFSNTVQGVLGRVKVDGKTGVAVGAYEVFAKGDVISQPDDFAVLQDGSVVLARPLGDTMQHIGLDRRVELLGKVNGATSAVVGKKKRGKEVVYVSTSGLVGGVAREGGRVVKVEF